MPHYAKFLKQLCTSMRKPKWKGIERVKVGEQVSAIIQEKFPAKYKNPGMFTIPCMIGDTKFEKAMLDSGASINVMQYFVYTSLKLGPLNKTNVIIQLVDKSNAYPKGVVDDVFMKVNELIFPADFFELDMRNSNHTTPIL